MNCAVFKAVREFTVGMAWLLAVVASVTVVPCAFFLVAVALGGEGAGAFLFFMVGLVAGCNLVAYLNDWRCL